jgi:hypothetical protein
MIRSFARHYSGAKPTVPFVGQPKNKFNAARSTFNMRPQLPQGLIHNPPAAAPSPKNTPRAFLPPLDPRLALAPHKRYTAEEVLHMPVVYASKATKSYEITPDQVAQMQALRSAAPAEWTVNKLAAKFGVTPDFVKVTTSIDSERKAQLARELAAQQQQWPLHKQKARVNRKRRVELWLRNEF